jgi:hypothetical protein
MTKVSTIFHPFGENISWVSFSCNMHHIESFVMYPFADRIFLELNVAICFRSYIVQPLDASVVVIVQNGGRGDIVDGVAMFRYTA